MDRITKPAQTTWLLAHEEAHALGHPQVGTGHLLLGLMLERDGMASRVLTNQGASYESMRAAVASTAHADGTDSTPPLPLTKNVELARQLSVREALSLGVHFVGTEHILLALVGMDNSSASRLLLANRIDRGTVRHELLRRLMRPTAQELIADRPTRCDFTPAEAFSLAARLVSASHEITFEINNGDDHEPTIQVVCKLRDDPRDDLRGLSVGGVNVSLVGDSQAARVARSDDLVPGPTRTRPIDT